MRRPLVLLALLLTLTFVPQVARAEAPPAAEPTTSEWYGWRVMAADAASFTLLVGLWVNLEPEWMLLSAGTHVALPAAIHVERGNPCRALVSAGLRLTLPVAGGLIGWAARGDLADNHDLIDEYASIAVGTLAGLATSMVIDWSVLSHRDVAPRPAAGPTYGMGVAPQPGGGMTFSLAGTF